MTGPSPRRPAQTPAHNTSPNQIVLQGLSSGGVTSRPESLSGQGPNIAHCRQGELLQTTGLKEQPKHNSKVHFALGTTWPLLHKVINFRSRRHNWLF